MKSFTGGSMINMDNNNWKQQFEVKNVLMRRQKKQIHPDVNCWTGVVWIIVMFLSAV